MKNATIGSEYLPNASIEKVILQSFPNNKKVIIDVCVYDHFNRTWSTSERFTRYLEISCFVVFEKELIARINNGEEALQNVNTGASTTKLFEQFDALEELTVKKRGKMYKKFKKRFEFLVPGRIRDLSCYAVSRINVKDLKDNEGLDLSYARNPGYMGSIESEKIIENQNLVFGSTLFKDAETSEPWGGPVHTHQGTAMVGSQHTSLPHSTLTKEEVENIKFSFFLDFDMPVGESRYEPLTNETTGPAETTSSMAPTSETAEAARITSYATQQIYSGFTGLPSNTTVPASAYTSDALHSAYYQMVPFEDMDRNVKNIVVLDMYSLLLQESRLGQLVSEADEGTAFSAGQYANLHSINVRRTRMKKESYLDAFGIRHNLTKDTDSTVIAKSNNSNTVVKTKTLYQTSVNKTFSVDPKLVKNINTNQIFDGKVIPTSLLNSSRKIGKIEQLNTSLPNNFRVLNIVDYDISSGGAGEYKYSLEISFRDVYYDFCNEFFNTLNKHMNKLDNFYNALILKNVYNGTDFDADFLVEFYSQYDIEINSEGMVVGDFATDSLKESFLIKSIEDLFKAETLIMRPQSRHYRNALNMFSTDMDKISSFITHYKKVINRFKQRYDLQDSHSYEKSSTKSRKDRGYIQKTIMMSEVYKKQQSIPIGVNFISSLIPTDEVPKINLLEFKNRANLEFNKFFTNSATDSNQITENVPSAMQSQFKNLNETKYKMFTPSRVYFGNQEINTTEINPKSFDADFFNSIRVAQSVLESAENNTDQDELKDNNSNLDQFTDSRDFLGNETSFNSKILRLIKLNPSAVSPARKKFRLLDNKILKANNSNFSLKTFDLSNETSPIINILQNNSEQVPMQIKALSLLKTPLTNFNLDNIDFDPLSNPQTQEVFSQNYLNIGKVEVLEGFEMINGRYMMKSPIFKEIEFNDIDKYESKNLVCRIVDTNFQNLGANHTGMMVYDRVFLMENSQDESPIDENTQVMQMSNPITDEAGETDQEVLSSTEGDFTTDLDMGSPLIDSSGQPVYRSDISNTVVTQNQLNNNVISVIPLREEQATTQVSTTFVEAPNTPLQATSTTPTGGPSY